MSGQNQQSLKKLLAGVPQGFLVDSAWLKANAIGRRSAYDYVAHGWLERLAHGVYRRPTQNTSPSNTVDWKISLLSVQHIMGYDVHVGGTTALAQHGHSHYLRLGGNAPVWLYGAQIPNWLKKLQLNVPLQTRSTSLFADSALGLEQSNDAEPSSALSDLPWEWSLRLSTPERAILEALDELPDHESFHNLDMIFESLTNLRPRKLAVLLKACTKIKVKRLFFVFADHHNHAWRKYLVPEDFDLGRGDRALIKGGRIHPQYRIMVPEEFTHPKREAHNGT